LCHKNLNPVGNKAQTQEEADAENYRILKLLERLMDDK